MRNKATSQGAQRSGDQRKVLCFEFQQKFLARQTAAKSGQLAVGADHAMARHDHRHRIPAIGESHSARCLGVPDARRASSP